MARNRELTTLEYIVLGLISMERQSGYSIVTYFESNTASWSASPGSIYPMLKRLESQMLIDGELEIEHETRPRKMYTITEAGGVLLDKWLRELPDLMPFYQEREIAMWRFLFMEHRLDRMDVLKWLKNYLELVRVSDAATQYHQRTIEALSESGQLSIHRELAIESSIMEVNSLRTWLEMAINRLTAIAKQTGEYEAVAQESDDG